MSDEMTGVPTEPGWYWWREADGDEWGPPISKYDGPPTGGLPASEDNDS